MSKVVDRRRFLLGAAAAATATALPASTLRANEVRQWDLSCDVLVLGSGAGGTSAAIEAADAGRSVLVLESLRELGGSSAMSGGVIYLGGGTPIQKACGFDDSVEDMYNFIVRAGRRHPQLDKIQLYCEQSLEHFHWLVAMGVPYKPSFSASKELPGSDDSLYYSGNERAWPWRELAAPVPRGHVPSEPGWTGGRRLMQALIPAAQKRGVRYLTGAAGERLIQADDGRVIGAAVTLDSAPRTVRARQGVVLACGGFIHNRDMLKRYAPALYDCSVPWGNMGDLGAGIQMGMAAGGAALQMEQGFSILPLYLPEQVLGGIVVNRSAQRFIAEDVYYAVLGDQIAFHQEGKAWLIADRHTRYAQLDYRVDIAAEAATLDELARQLPLPPGALQHTLDYHNEHARRGEDPLFHKQRDFIRPLEEPPFVAYDLAVDKAFFAAHTFGGLHTNLHGQVLDAWQQPIAGLYAAGRSSAGLPASPYIASGLSVGDATFFGRRAGRHAGAAS